MSSVAPLLVKPRMRRRRRLTLWRPPLPTVIARIVIPNQEPVFAVAGANGRLWVQNNRERALTGQEIGVIVAAGMIQHTRVPTTRQKTVVKRYLKQAL